MQNLKGHRTSGCGVEFRLDLQAFFAKFSVNKIGKQVAVSEIMHNFKEDN